MNHRFAVLCQTVTVDSLTNNITLVNLIDQLTLDIDVESLSTGTLEPDDRLTVPFSATFVVFTERSNLEEEESTRGRIVIKGPKGQEFSSSVFDVDLSEHRRVRSMLQFNVFPFIGPGNYQIEVQYEDDGAGSWKSVDSISLEVFVRESSHVNVIESK